MGQNIVLTAILDTKDVETKLKRLSTTGQSSQKSGGTLPAITNQVGKLGAASDKTFSPLVTGLHNMGLKGESLIGIFGTLALKVSTWLIATAGVFAVIRMFKSLVTEMKALEDATIRLQRILPTSGKALEAQTRAAFEFGKEMNMLAGALLPDTIDALTIAKKAGFSFADSMMIAKSALLAINVTEIDNIENATRFLLATIRQFGLEAKDSMNILDQWNELAKRTGATAEQIAEGVTRSGKAFQAVGGTLAQLNAITAATIEATGESGNKIGTMLKTLSARFADVNRAKSLDNELSRHNIRILKDQEGNFHDIFSVLAAVSGKWDTLADSQKAAIAKAAAGVRQYSRFLGVVENFDNIMKGLIVSIDSQNSALTENEKRVKSLDFAIRNLKGAWSELAMESSGLLKTMKVVVNLTASFVRGLSSIEGKILGLVAIVGSLVIAFAVLKSAILATLTAIGITTGPIGWIATGIAAAVVALVGFTAKAGAANLALQRVANSATDSAVALSNSRQELLQNVNALVRTHQAINTTLERKEQIEEMFQNVAGINLRETINQFDTTADAVKNLALQLNKLTSVKTILKEFSLNIRKNIAGRSRGQARKARHKDKSLALANVADFIASQADPAEAIASRIKKAKDLLGVDEIFTMFKQFADIPIRGILNAGQDKTRRFSEGFTELPDDQFQKMVKYAKMIFDITGQTDLSMADWLYSLEQVGILIPQITKQGKKMTDMFAKTAEEINKINAALVDGFLEGLFELTEDGTFMDNFIAAFEGLGEVIYDTFRDSVAAGIIKGLEDNVLISSISEQVSKISYDATKSISKFLSDLNGNSKTIGSTFPKGAPRDLALGDALGGAFLGAAAGGFTAGVTGRKAGDGMMIGGSISALMVMNPATKPFALLGGLLGGLLAQQTPEDKQEEDKVKYARESVKELKSVNRNLTTIIETQPNFQILPESYFFSVNTTRGLS